MKITQLEMGLMKIQAETPAESQAICGILEMLCKWMPAAIVNNHGCRKVGKDYFNWCVIPDGHLDDDGRRDGIVAGLKTWRKLPCDYVFKPRKGKS